jgi:hypothetical protein
MRCDNASDEGWRGMPAPRPHQHRATFYFGRAKFARFYLRVVTPMEGKCSCDTNMYHALKLAAISRKLMNNK